MSSAGDASPEPSTTEQTPRGKPRSGMKYRAYTQADIDAAIRAVLEEGASLRKASIQHHVPKTTLSDRLGDQRPGLPPLTTPRSASHSNKLATRYAWTENDMASAVQAVHEGSPLTDAARRFGVPSSTLNSRTRGRQPKDLKTELSRLSLTQEKLLADWAFAQGELGFPPRKDEIHELAEKVLRRSGEGRRLGKQWLSHWLRRYPKVRPLEWKDKQDNRRVSEAEQDGQSFTEASLNLLEHRAPAD